MVYDISVYADAFGMIGTFMVCVAFFQSVNGRWKTTENSYLWTNLIGAVILLISLCVNFNLGSFVIELFWITISLMGFYKNYKMKQ